jgi:hypothetical protein
MRLPLVKPGFYLDYALLSSCSEDSCSAVTKCPNPKACPGFGEKNCLKNDEVCYDSSVAGCVKCCGGFYNEELTCHRCPEGRLLLLLALALVALILFVGISSSIDFPPAISVISGLKIFVVGMQNFVGIRSFEIAWPSIVQQMFDFSRFFSFSVDVVRPECSVSFDPDVKLASVLIGPFACVIVVCFMMVIYVAFKSWIISRALQHDSLTPHLPWNFQRTLASVRSCLITSAMCFKFRPNQIMKHGILWHALDHHILERSDAVVLNQRARRGATGSASVTVGAFQSKTIKRTPDEWEVFKNAVQKLGITNNFDRSTQRFRLMLSSAASIFVFTFQGNTETALSTFDCPEGFLRKSPTIKCSVSDAMYLRVLIISLFGLILYCLVLPLGVVLALNSRWSRDVFMHNNVAYNHLFGFLTAIYRKDCKFWELAGCIRKACLVAIPILLTKQTIEQIISVSMTMLVYTFFVMYVKPMRNTYLNNLELLSCVAVLVGSFTSIFFVVEFNGEKLLSGVAKDFVGFIFVLICAASFALSLVCIHRDFARLYMLHKILFLKSWSAAISARLGAAITEGSFVPLIAAFYNKVSSTDFFKLKFEIQSDQSNFKQLTFSNQFSALGHINAKLRCWFHKKIRLFHAHRYNPDPETIDDCIKSPELDALIYLQKLSERVQRWESVSWKYWNVEPNNLPEEFREVSGEADPPHAEVAYQANVIHMLEDALPPNIHRVLTTLMFSYFMNLPRSNVTETQRMYESTPSHFPTAPHFPSDFVHVLVCAAIKARFAGTTKEC